MAIYDLRITIYDLGSRVAGGLRVAGCRFQVSGFRFQVSGFRLQVAKVIITSLAVIPNSAEQKSAQGIPSVESPPDFSSNGRNRSALLSSFYVEIQAI